MTDLAFEFSLAPHPALDTALPVAAPCPSWGALSAGSYALRVGATHLLKYAAAFGGGPVSHPVVRLHEDVLGILPNAREGVPDDVMASLPERSVAALGRRLRARADALEASDELDALEAAGALLEATAVLEGRRLDTGYLDPPADIWLWRHEDTLVVEWDQRDKVRDARCVWSAEHGRDELPLAAFVAAIEDFHLRFTAAMRTRMSALAARLELAERRDERAALEAEQAWREGRLAAALSRRADAGDWAHVRAALGRD